MPKKLLYPKETQVASIKLEWKSYQVIAKMDQTNIGKVLYYQVKCRRKKIANFTNKELAIRKMFAEANYELQNLFELESIGVNKKITYTLEDLIKDDLTNKNIQYK